MLCSGFGSQYKGFSAIEEVCVCGGGGGDHVHNENAEGGLVGKDCPIVHEVPV